MRCIYQCSDCFGDMLLVIITFVSVCFVVYMVYYKIRCWVEDICEEKIKEVIERKKRLNKMLGGN